MGDVQRLAADRVSRLTGLVRNNRQTLELDDRGDPSVRGEILGVDIDPAAIAAAQDAGFRVVEEGEIEGLGIHSVRLAAPDGMALGRALKAIRKAAPGTWSANQLHFESGATAATSGHPLRSQAATGARIGMIDGGVGQHPALSGPIEQRGFARGAPSASAHGTAIASLIAGQTGFRGVLPGAPMLAADVYGADPAGGNALAISRAIGWMATREVRVVTVSLVGPANPLLAKVIARTRTRDDDRSGGGQRRPRRATGLSRLLSRRDRRHRRRRPQPCADRGGPRSISIMLRPARTCWARSPAAAP